MNAAPPRSRSVVTLIRWLSSFALTLVWLSACPVPSIAQPVPTSSDLLFENQAWGVAPPGTVLAYRYARANPVAAEVFGPPIEDTIRLTLDPGPDAVRRNVRVEMFSGEHRRPAGPFEAVAFNPVLILFLEHHVGDLARALGANPRYLKNAIRAALRDHAQITSTEVPFKGAAVRGWQVVVSPFEADEHKARLRGLDGLRYSFVVADAVPGSVLSVLAEARGPDGASLIKESLSYDPDGR